jgi:hypothetical protein
MPKYKKLYIYLVIILLSSIYMSLYYSMMDVNVIALSPYPDGEEYNSSNINLPIKYDTIGLIDGRKYTTPYRDTCSLNIIFAPADQIHDLLRVIKKILSGGHLRVQ